MAPAKHMYEKAKKKVFVSFDFDNDQFLRDSFYGQARLEGTPYELHDWSVKEPWGSTVWKEECRKRIRKCDIVIVMIGEKTSQCSGVKAEIQMARAEGIPVVGIKGYQNKNCPRPDGLEGYYKWTWENVEKLVKGYR